MVFNSVFYKIKPYDNKQYEKKKKKKVETWALISLCTIAFFKIHSPIWFLLCISLLFILKFEDLRFLVQLLMKFQ